MYINETTNQIYPKTLVIRNEPTGMIWQLYNVNNETEASILASNAKRNGFYGITLEDYDPTHEETFPDWRQTKGGKAIIEMAQSVQADDQDSVQANELDQAGHETNLNLEQS